ncbi:hypothetical protein CAPTEDRAFT_151988 [Capitella teleta]|uniref:Protein kinase domain-containing protein n=1 Tax=Capitella teleta TaxID=283909 RepID=R7UJQ9_CAPTE|nr:hypothetical protein CAPTEDRAFT_151988 [Capitella teleta]|eukprot:ELU03482.1 hypothetical protein CAPTEDRAFT_151988 [Capitella teleta]
MLFRQRGRCYFDGRESAEIQLMQPRTNSTQREFASKYLEGQIRIVEKLRKIANIEVPLGFAIQQGLRQPVFEYPALLLSDHLKGGARMYENVDPKLKHTYENLIAYESETKAIFCGISSGLLHLHEAGALLYGLNTRSVLIHKKGEDLIAKLSSFSEAPLVAQRDQMDFAEGKWDVRRLAPETMDSLEHTCKSDVWAMAILFWEIISGCEPFYAFARDNEVEAAIKRGFRMEKPSDCKPKMYDLMNQCWMLDPENRPTALKVTEELSKMENVVFRSKTQ